MYSEESKTIFGDRNIDAIRLEALKFARIGLLRFSFDGTVLFIDNGAFAILGLGKYFDAPASLIGKNINNLFTRTENQPPIVDKIIGARQIRDYEFEFITLAGEKRFAMCDAYIVVDEVTGSEAIQLIARNITRRKTAESALLQSEEKFRSVTDEIADAAMIIVRGEISWINNSATRIFGTAAQAFAGRGVDSFLKEESLKILSNTIDSLLDGKRPGPIMQELKGYRDNGDAVDLEISIKKIQFDGDDAIQLVIHDITERNIANDKLLRLAFEFQGVFEAFPDLYFRFDRDGSILDAKASNITDFYMPPLEFINRNVRDIFPGETGDALAEKITEVVNGKAQASLIYSLPYPDGNRYFEARFIHLPEGHVGAFIRDMTELKNTEQKLIESEKFLANIFDNIQDAISVLDKDLTILRVNRATKERFKGAAQIEGRKCYSVYHNSEAPCDNCTSMKALQTGVACSNIIQMPETANGNSGNWLELFAFPLLDPDKRESIGVIEFVRDVTARVKAEEEVRNYREQLETLIGKRTAELNKAYDKLLASERLAVLGQFAGGISHEIRNPLNVIATTIYYLKRKVLHSDERVVPMLDKVQKQIDACSAIIDCILRLTQLQAPMLKRVEIISFIKETIDRKDLPSKIALTTKLPERPINAMIDSGQISIALNNLIKNAVQAMPDGGEITIEADRIIENGVNQAVINVTDTGGGITLENMEKIFEPLFTTKIHGIGFGLSIVKAILEKHDGRISVESEPEKGTKFSLYFPCDP